MTPKENVQVLVLEDEPVASILIGHILSKMGLSYTMVTDGLLGLKALEQNNYNIYIVDLLMPNMDGTTFIRELRKIQEDAVVLVQTTVNVPETIVEVMRLQVFDYIFKPFNVTEFQQSVKSAIDFYRYKQSQKERSTQISMQLRSQLEWLNYKEHRRQSESTSQEKNLLYNLKTSMSQGAGIGALLSLLQLAEATLKKDGDSCIIPSSIMDMIFTNMNISKQMIDGLISISDILEAHIELEPKNASDIRTLIEKKADELSDIMDNRHIRFTLSDILHDSSVNINSQALDTVFEELLINALKYSPDRGELICFFHYSQGYLVISFMNDIDSQSGGKGVPPESEKLVIEPFIRFANPNEAVAAREKYSIGLGLSVVDHIARVHNGQFFIRNITDHLRENPEICVLAEFLIPMKIQ